ncbi:MAG TPA: S24 family peptidase [Alphaproteobacteria bacterium]|nr:S24 family peptidase [Alphaproteobacteria bacterium]
MRRKLAPVMTIPAKPSLPAALRALRERAGLSMDALARELGYRGASSYQRYESEEFRKPYLPMDLAERLAAALGGRGTPPVAPQEVLALAGVSRGPAAGHEVRPQGARSVVAAETPRTPVQGEAAGPLVEIGAREYAAIPVFDLRLSAGPGAFVEEAPEPLFHQMFEHQWLRRLTVTSVDALILARISGDSMEDTLRDGDQVLVDLTRRHVSSDGLYGYRIDDELQVKRIARHPVTNLLTIRSDNPRYPSWPDVAPDSITIIGRVVWLGRQV